MPYLWVDQNSVSRDTVGGVKVPGQLLEQEEDGVELHKKHLLGKSAVQEAQGIMPDERLRLR